MTKVKAARLEACIENEISSLIKSGARHSIGFFHTSSSVFVFTLRDLDQRPESTVFNKLQISSCMNSSEFLYGALSVLMCSTEVH